MCCLNLNLFMGNLKYLSMFSQVLASSLCQGFQQDNSTENAHFTEAALSILDPRCSRCAAKRRDTSRTALCQVKIAETSKIETQNKIYQNMDRGIPKSKLRVPPNTSKRPFYIDLYSIETFFGGGSPMKIQVDNPGSLNPKVQSCGGSSSTQAFANWNITFKLIGKSW